MVVSKVIAQLALLLVLGPQLVEVSEVRNGGPNYIVRGPTLVVDQLQLLMLVLAGQQGLSGHEFCKEASNCLSLGFIAYPHDQMSMALE